MHRIAVLFATSEGHTRTIAHHVVGLLTQRGVPAEAHEVSSDGALAALDASTAVILAASIHVGEHQRRFVQFVREHRELLDARPNLLLQVSLTAAEDDDEARAQVAAFEKAFEEAAGWRPAHWEPVAGAVLYRQLGLVRRYMVRLVMGMVGGPTDMSKNHVMTRWPALDAAVGRFVDEVEGGAAA